MNICDLCRPRKVARSCEHVCEWPTKSCESADKKVWMRRLFCECPPKKCEWARTFPWLSRPKVWTRVWSKLRLTGDVLRRKGPWPLISSARSCRDRLSASCIFFWPTHLLPSVFGTARLVFALYTLPSAYPNAQDQLRTWLSLPFPIFWLPKFDLIFFDFKIFMISGLSNLQAVKFSANTQYIPFKNILSSYYDFITKYHK